MDRRHFLKTSAGVAGLTARAAADGALYNVLINLQSISDQTFTTAIRQRALMAASPLCDRSGLARDLEQAFVAMFDDWAPQVRI